MPDLSENGKLFRAFILTLHHNKMFRLCPISYFQDIKWGLEITDRELDSIAMDAVLIDNGMELNVPADDYIQRNHDLTREGDILASLIIEARKNEFYPFAAMCVVFAFILQISHDDKQYIHEHLHVFQEFGGVNDGR